MQKQKKERPVLFIDRDGTINIDGGYINQPDNFVIYPFAAQAIRMLNMAGWLAVVVTNQSGIGRGFYTEEVMQSIHSKMYAHFASQGANVDALYYCPHDPNSKIDKYKQICHCRKPEPGMLEQAMAELNIDRERMYIVGDKYGDMQAGFAVGCKTIMVETGYGKGEFKYKSGNWAKQPDYRAANLLEAVRIAIHHTL